MALKFFTWTKGDRRNAEETMRSGGVVPIPAECLTLKGMSYSKSTTKSAASGRTIPPPLTLTANTPTRNTDRQCLSASSLVLHDAAVESATNLLAVVNSILSSPHLTPRTCSNDVPQSYGRPRSRTAPPTPMYEAGYVEPVELFAPQSLDPRKYHKSHDSLPNICKKSLENSDALPNVRRPHSSPTKETHEQDQEVRTPVGVHQQTLTALGTSQPPLRSPKKSRQDSSYAAMATRPNSNRSEDLSIIHRKTPRPALSIMQSWPKSQSTCDAPPDYPHDARRAQPHSFPGHIHKEASTPLKDDDDLDSLLATELESLRESHETYLSSLNEAHSREVASLRIYIGLLEQHKHSSRPAHFASTKSSSLTIDTSQASTKVGELSSADASATTSHSWESALENQKRASQEAAVEVESLKRKLSVSRRREALTDDIRLERDALKRSHEISNRRLSQLKDILNKAKDNEKALRNTVDTLESRLEAANNQKLDILEGYHEAREKARRMYEREGILSKQIEELRLQPFEAQLNESMAKLFAAEKHVALLQRQRAAPDQAGFAPLMASLQEQLTATQDDNEAKACRIAQLEQQLQTTTQGQRSVTPLAEAAGTEVVEIGQHISPLVSMKAISQPDHEHLLEHDLEANAIIRKLEVEKDQLSSLLRNELRRQARLEAKLSDAKTSSDPVQDEASVPTEKNSRTRSEDVVPEEKPDSVQQTDRSAKSYADEIRALVKEIVLYKLDIKGYKKDLKRAKNSVYRLERALDESRAQQLDTLHLRQPKLEAEQSHELPSGLGISLLEENHVPAPPDDLSLATRLAILSASPNLRPPPLPPRTPPSRAKTPSGAHKRLPRPPSAKTPVPSPANTPPADLIALPEFDRAETLRSLSESIISSYAHQVTPELIGQNQASAYGRKQGKTGHRKSEPVSKGMIVRDQSQHVMDLFS